MRRALEKRVTIISKLWRTIGVMFLCFERSVSRLLHEPMFILAGAALERLRKQF